MALKQKTYLITIEDRLGNRSNVKATGTHPHAAIKKINRESFSVIALRPVASKGNGANS